MQLALAPNGQGSSEGPNLGKFAGADDADPLVGRDRQEALIFRDDQFGFQADGAFDKLCVSRIKPGNGQLGWLRGEHLHYENRSGK